MNVEAQSKGVYSRQERPEKRDVAIWSMDDIDAVILPGGGREQIKKVPQDQIS